MSEGVRMNSEPKSKDADEDESKWSFLRRLITAMAEQREQRLKKADEIVRQWPPARRGDHD
jgi:hypothetical protein